MEERQSTNMARSYHVDVVRSGSWWAISVPELPGVFSQARRLDQVEEMVREAIALYLDAPADEIGAIEIDVTPPESVGALLETVRMSTAEAERAITRATEARHEVARTLRNEGLPTRDIGALLGISHQRVSQILAN